MNRRFIPRSYQFGPYIQLFLILMLSSFCHTLRGQVDVLRVNWPQFIAKQDLHWNEVPKEWKEAPFVGNGLMGSMLFQTAPNQLTIQIGRQDVQDHRMQSGKEATDRVLPDQSRLPIGYFTLNTVGEIKACDLRLNLWDAEISGTLSTDRGEIDLTALVHSDANLLLVEARAGQGEEAFTYEWHPEEAFCPRVKGKRAGGKSYMDAYSPSPLPIQEMSGDVNLTVQSLLSDGQTATAWIVRERANTKTLYASVGHSFPGATARDEALAVVEALSNKSLEELQKTHRVWWHAFYPKSFVSLPDQRMQSFFWIQHYKMACATKGGSSLADNQGPWLQPTGWPALWWNLNVQLAYSHMLPANHEALSVGLLNTLVKHQDNLVKNVPEHMRADSMAINTVSGQDLLSPMGDPNDPKQKPLATGNFTWAMHNCYMQYRYTMDEDMLRDKIYPLLTKAINYYRHFMIEGEDGRIHLPITNSPEYANVGDCNYDLSLLQWGCQALIDSAQTLGIDDPLVPVWQDILERLVDYPQNETGYMIGAGKSYDDSHRHYSHLLMFYPLAILDLDNPEIRALAKQSLLHWQSKPERLAGYSYTGSSSMFSLLGDGEMAEQRMQDFFADKILPNTFYAEGSPVIETPPAAARSIEDMLIQSWGDTIRVFPSIPLKWQELAFADLRTEGAFLVSASRKGGKTSFIAIKSLAGAPCRIQTSIVGKLEVFGVDAGQVKQLGDGLVELDLKKGEQVILANASYARKVGIHTIQEVPSEFYADWKWGKLEDTSSVKK
ncbi:MAG: glycosyl hydrolase family 95 catalytic domain-containing protein [Lentimonas sp.]